jgi:hypothetical protein
LKAESNVLKASRILPRLFSSGSSEDSVHQQWHATDGLLNSLLGCVDDKEVIQQLISRSQLFRQLCKCLSLGLQQLTTTTAEAVTGADAPALAIATHVASCTVTLLSSTSEPTCLVKLATAARECGEHCRPADSASEQANLINMFNVV